MPIGSLLTVGDIATMVGVEVTTVHGYRRDPLHRRFPDPWGYVGATPVWTRMQVTEWLNGRASRDWTTATNTAPRSSGTGAPRRQEGMTPPRKDKR